MQEPDDWPTEKERPWGLRLLALVGVVAFVMLGINSLLPIFQQPVPRPAPKLPDRGDRTA